MVAASLFTVGLMGVAFAPTGTGAELDDQGWCAAAAGNLVEQNGVKLAGTSIEYSCGLGAVSVEVLAKDGSTYSFSEQLSPAASTTSSSGQALRAVNCVDAPPTRTIINELQVDINLCVIYGQVDSPVNDTWTRSIIVDWTVYPGWNSAQSRISTIPSEGSPTLTGTVTSQRQNGVLPPTELSSAAFTMSGNDVQAGYVVGGLTTGGSHSVKMEDLEVSDPTYSFNHVVGVGEATPRFECDSEQERCFYPNGEEAGL
ncbi:hypothetical protein [Rathayibacter tritici]|uniref:hypothetical protein n=1 Tax=Rathayibacter tritici TaxID=33888 RepID=UPI0011AFD816|nr:hypothetical protein [Rathayibacter tritici]